MNEKEQLEHFKAKLRAAMNKVPDKIASGSIQDTRAWMGRRKQADKVLNKRGVTVTDLLSAITSLQ
jgi:hypothetical protein